METVRADVPLTLRPHRPATALPLGRKRSIRALARDPRHFQIAVLTTLLIYGCAVLGFRVTVGRILSIVAVALGTQWALAHGSSRATAQAHSKDPLGTVLPPFDFRSPLISSLSLCLLLRTDTLALAALAAFLTIASKYLLRWRGKHLFNPANFGIAALTLTTSHAWVSPGQWGSVALLGFALAGLGGLVVYRAARSDVTLAFLGGYAGFLLARAAWLGDPWAIPLHQLSSGALLLFAFFMISDPKTTPNARAGRILHGLFVAALALAFRFVLFEPDGLLWSLFLAAPLVPLWDRIFRGRAYDWARPRGGTSPDSDPDTKGAPMPFSKPLAGATLALLGLAFLVQSASAFCGFYVAKADARLYNQASQVVLVRDGDRTVITMASDYRGEPSEFALVVPVPTVLQEEQIHVTEQALLDHLDAYSAPRLVEYYDEDPCRPVVYEMMSRSTGAASPAGDRRDNEAARELGVTIEARYTVGEYDILILSAEESDGLETWLVRNGYRIPEGAGRVLGSYLKQGMKFFVAKVNLGEQEKLGFQNLRPIQIAFESPKFMLPIRLGTVNADGAQEMFVYALTRSGRVESTNYRTIRLPSDLEIPTFVKDDFASFYKAMFDHQWEKEGRNVLFLEYAWDMAWCDPCAADPLSAEQLRELGVFWVQGDPYGRDRRVAPPAMPAQDVFITRLHVRYDARLFPEDLVFRETGDRQNFQGRYVLRHPWTGPADCEAARRYFEGLPERHRREAETLASLTGWELGDILRDMEIPGLPASEGPWWKRLWNDR